VLRLELFGYSSTESFDVRDRLAHLILPVLCLAMPFGAWSSLIFADFFRAHRSSWRIARPVTMTVALIGPALIVTPLWGVVSRRIGKERGFAVASIVFGAAALSMLALLWAPGAWVYLPVALVGAGYAGMQSLPMAMLPDVISHDASANGEGRAGTFGGMWTAGETTGMALGATTLTVVLALSGYIARTAGPAAVAVGETQPAGAVAGIVLSFSLVPAAIVAASLIPLARYRLRKEDIDGRV